VPDRVNAIMGAPIPTNVSQIRSFLGTINYYGAFVPDLSTRLASLNNLLRSDVEWSWSTKADSAFLDIKKCLSSAPILTMTHFYLLYCSCI
jgi:hypothetical protein